jgi:hypothetical protein
VAGRRGRNRHHRQGDVFHRAHFSWLGWRVGTAGASHGVVSLIPHGVSITIGALVIVLGVALMALGFLLDASLLVILGLVLAVVGVVMLLRRAHGGDR